MSDYQKYEQIKQYLLTLELTHEQYTAMIKAVAEALGI